MRADNRYQTLTARRSSPALPERYLEVGRPPRRRPPDRRSRARQRWRRRLRLLVVMPVLITLYFIWSFFGAISTPGNQSFSAKWADWLRSHHAALLVKQLELYYYTHNAPPKGGRPAHLNALPPSAKGAARGTAPSGNQAPGSALRTQRARTGTALSADRPLPPPSPVPLVVSPALPGEGVWQPVGPLVHGKPGMYEAQFRADTVYTSEITTAVWIDPRVMHVSLVPGLTEPGGTWTHPPYITPAELPHIAAAFNGGFLFQDAKGGFYLDGRTAVPLVPGAASAVIYRDGRVNIGAWGTEVTMTPNVVAVLQNLVPMVDHGKVSPSATYNDTSVWGATLGAAIVVPRSGLGVTRDGALVYVAGPALTAKTLAESLQRAGAVRAMTLDINPEWVTFNFFTHPNPTDPAQVVGTKLYPQMQRSSSRYLPPTLEARDFFTVSAP